MIVEKLNDTQMNILSNLDLEPLGFELQKCFTDSHLFLLPNHGGIRGIFPSGVEAPINALLLGGTVSVLRS